MARSSDTQLSAAALNDCPANRRKLGVCHSVVQMGSGLLIALRQQPRTVRRQTSADVSTNSRVVISQNLALWL